MTNIALIAFLALSVALLFSAVALVVVLKSFGWFREIAQMQVRWLDKERTFWESYRELLAKYEALNETYARSEGKPWIPPMLPEARYRPPEPNAFKMKPITPRNVERDGETV